MNNAEPISEKTLQCKGIKPVFGLPATGQRLFEERKISLNKNRKKENFRISESKNETLNRKSIPLNLTHLLRLMNEKKASDLHLSTGCHPIMRVDGDILSVHNHPLIAEGELCQELIKITPERNWEEFDRTSDTDFGFELKGTARFRCNIFRDHRGCGSVFRLIPEKILSVGELQIPEAFVNLCQVPKGLILVTGPTGSGKSTTLAAMIDHINQTQKKHIITVEDPIEFIHPNRLSIINQREINSHTRSFKTALCAALREDPDVILAGEMRDLETISIALEMAVTGHLVFGTLHTSTAIATVNRIIDQFPANQQSRIRTMLAESLIGVCSQTLLKKKSGGRAGAYEILIVTIAVSNLIREGKSYQIATLMQTGKSQGMRMLNTALSELVDKGIIEEPEALDKTTDRENLKTLFKFREELAASEIGTSREKSFNSSRE